MNKSVTISARVSQEDAQFISQLNIENAKTPSDKFRAIISEARRRDISQHDFSGNLTSFQNMITPVRNQVCESELAQQTHSELVLRTLDWMPDTMAFIISALQQGDINEEQLVSLEQGIANRVFQLIESTLQLAITQRSACYSPNTIDDRIEPILDLLKAINVKQTSNSNKEEL